ncbi:hypothetical protein HanIR_Chr13g0656891 [Helianthus annuus]|nr:hypothetical protein HanIR_Chr13g0656891 [Helianthus annuus]
MTFLKLSLIVRAINFRVSVTNQSQPVSIIRETYEGYINENSITVSTTTHLDILTYGTLTFDTLITNTLSLFE